MFYRYYGEGKLFLSSEVIVHWKEAKQEATSKCVNWGYDKADRFGVGRKRCLRRSDYGCLVYEVIHKYQCIE